MPSIAKTKSGERYRAPTDQARKMERRRENKRNKRDRQQIRQTMAKCLNLDDTTAKLLTLERQILGLDPPTFHIDVLKKKQKVLTDLINKRRMTLQQAKDDEGLKRFNEKLAIYNADCKRLATLAQQARMAREADPESIPLPAGDIMGTSAEIRHTQLYGPTPTIPKKVDFKLPARAPRSNMKPPGPPIGLAPDYSDSEDERYQEGRIDDEDLAPVPIPEFDVPHNVYQPQTANIYRNVAYNQPRVPPVPRFPYNPMGFSSETATISSAPQITRGEVDATLSAAPELRNLRKETVKLVPTQLVRRPDKKLPVPRPVQKHHQPEQQHQAKSTDEAYNDFMKELEGLI